ncbi:MAG: hypothetical protein GHCLOJNM_02164 [bacterium]|nr:hypothetical protein [bacterium]
MKPMHSISGGRPWPWILALALCAMSGGAYADDVEEFLIQDAQQRYFDLPLDARSLALGGSNIATADDLASVFGNPAGLGFIDHCGASFTYSRDEINGDEFPFTNAIGRDYDVGTLRIALPIRMGGTVGFGYSASEGETSDLQDTEVDRELYNFAYGLRLNPCMSLGYSFTWVQDEVDGRWGDYEMDDGYRHTLGLQCRPSACTALGLSGFYASGDPESDIIIIGPQNGDRESWGVELGGAWQVFERTRLTSSVDYVSYDLDSNIRLANVPVANLVPADEDGQSWTVRAGIEQKCCDWLTGRVGYLYRDNTYDFKDPILAANLNDSLDYHAVSTGLGLNICQNLTVDYGFQYRFLGDGDVTNTVTATFHF